MVWCADILNWFDPVPGNHIHVPRNGIGHGDVDGHIIFQSEFIHIFLRNEANAPNVIIIYIGQDVAGEFFLIAGECFKEIAGGGVNMFDTGRPLQDFVDKAHDLSRDEKELT